MESLSLVRYADILKGCTLYEPVPQTVTVARNVAVIDKENDGMTTQLIVDEANAGKQNSVGKERSRK